MVRRALGLESCPLRVQRIARASPRPSRLAEGQCSVNSHGVVGNELPHEPFVVTELRVGVGAQVFEGVVRVAIVPKVGILRPGVSDTSAFIGGHPSESWPAPRRMGAVIAAGVVMLLLDSDAVLSRANRRVADRAHRLLGEWGLIRFHLT
jgi:hypothetical protein